VSPVDLKRTSTSDFDGVVKNTNVTGKSTKVVVLKVEG
jgi:hypothetical protein